MEPALELLDQSTHRWSRRLQATHLHSSTPTWSRTSVRASVGCSRAPAGSAPRTPPPRTWRPPHVHCASRDSELSAGAERAGRMMAALGTADASMWTRAESGRHTANLTNSSGGNLSGLLFSHDENNAFGSDGDGQDTFASLAFLYLNGVVIPSIGVLGVVGNLLNLAILTWRCVNREDDTLEKVALVGLIALAVSDLCFCITILPLFAFPKPKTIFEAPCFGLYYQVYGEYTQNVFIKTSTWLTMIVATARYIAICHPLKARLCFGIRPTRIAIISTYAFWFVILLPLLWSLQITPFEFTSDVENSTVYIIDTGEFSRNKTLQTTFTYLWAFVGYFIPVAILAFCNVCLIRALRESRRLRQSVAHTARVHTYTSNKNSSNRITLTLIALVLMFMLLVSPSELLHFWLQLTHDSFPAFEMSMLFANVLQVINFALHFVLYCVVNVTFRRTLLNLAYMCVSFIQRPHLPMYRRRESLSRRSTITPSAMRSNETNI